LSIELAVEDFSGGELVEELALSWLEIIELVITFFCCKNNYVLVRKMSWQNHSPEAQHNTVQCFGSISDQYPTGSSDPDWESGFGSSQVV
jgi:hypothetical protein